MKVSDATAYSEYARMHGPCKSLARTQMESGADGPMIVSTAILANGFGIAGGVFTFYETRVFGGKADGLHASFRSVGDPHDAIRRAIGEHAAAMRKVVDAYVSPADAGETGDV